LVIKVSHNLLLLQLTVDIVVHHINICGPPYWLAAFSPIGDLLFTIMVGLAIVAYRRIFIYIRGSYIVNHDPDSLRSSYIPWISTLVGSVGLLIIGVTVSFIIAMMHDFDVMEFFTLCIFVVNSNDIFYS